jgi:ketosteroid isomerase-like protein
MSRMAIPLMLIITAACRPDAGPLSEDDIAALRDLGQSYVRGFSTNDPDAVAAVYAEDAVEMPPGYAPRNGLEDIRTAYAAYFEGGAQTIDFAMLTAGIGGSGGQAFDRGTWSWTGREQAGSGPVIQTGYYLAVARRQEDGSWRYVAMMWTVEQATPSGQP